jgi:two-component system, OmpR family, KDP operon response regulator KdpE
MKELVLIIEDDKALNKMLSFALEQEGYKAIIAEDLKNAHRHFQVHKPDIILLDLGLPDGDGKSFIKIVRHEVSTPIIILSARNDEKEIVTSLDMGADDYVTKPFSMHELFARMRSAYRRASGLNLSSHLLTCGSLSIDTQLHSAYKHTQLLKLTPTEFNLLKYCMLHPNQVLVHARLLKEVWGVGYQQEMQYLRTFINSLRKKIEDDPTRPRYIITEMGIGYRFFCENSSYQKE